MPANRDSRETGWFRRVPLSVAVLAVVSLGAAISVVVVELVTSSGPDVKPPYTVVYTVTGTVSTADITWYQDAGANESSSDFVNNHGLPWSNTTVVTGPFPTFTLTAMASTANQAGELTCKITVDGALRSRQTLRGSDPSVACDDSEAGT